MESCVSNIKLCDLKCTFCIFFLMLIHFFLHATLLIGLVLWKVLDQQRANSLLLALKPFGLNQFVLQTVDDLDPGRSQNLESCH